MSTDQGRQAEDLASKFLEGQKLTVLARNWRNRWCEIDIVAESKDKTVHFVEVKYRRTDAFGSGFDYITADKAARLVRAAAAWMVENGQNRAYQIDVISVAGAFDDPDIDYLPNAVSG